jgi:hypothetical protein
MEQYFVKIMQIEATNKLLPWSNRHASQESELKHLAQPPSN